MNKKMIISAISLLAILLLSTPLAFGVSSPGSPATPQIHFPRGTICGDAQLGAWAPAQFNGRSNFQGLFSLFTVNKMVLSGGNSGTVKSSSGSLAVFSQKFGTLLFYATYKGMHGSYSIQGRTMLLTGFTASNIVVFFNHIKNHPPDGKVKAMTYPGPVRIPNQALPCSTQDALVSSTA